ncbi:MAG TPA: response regulator [Candidatus Thermoplasmatota archaeon]|nr:response regulator [Candidatus Thermoplasmatota archaeon]
MESDVARARLRILVVDDDRFMLDMLPMWLETAFPGWGPPEIRTARSPREVLARISAECPDVVLSDYDLRDTMNGVRLLEQVGARCPGTVRVLFSGHAPEEIGTDLDNKSLHGFIEKPMRIEEMLEPFRTLVERHLVPAS